ncbi:MAG TPA: hypothetical protein PKD45_13280 [Flavobacteriales bacterium]|nr:hypothetical protein [Flavobacteriales bacterium]
MSKPDTKTGTVRRKRSAARKGVSTRPTRQAKAEPYIQPYDAKKYAGTVPAFAEITLEEMRAWRDDR